MMLFGEFVKKGGDYLKEKQARKKFVRYKDGAERYSLGIQNFMKIAKEAGAVRKIRGTVLVNTEKLDEYIDSFEVRE